MSSMQIIFLFDLNACSDYLLRSKDELNKKLLSIRLTCMRLLTYFSTKTPNLKWGYKFFDSNGSITQTMSKFSSSDVSLESFETLENEICVRNERHIALLQALEASQKSVPSLNLLTQVESVNSYPIKILQFALTQILCEFQWESMDMWSPSARKFKDNFLFKGKRNFVFLFSDFKDNDDMLFNYFGLNTLPSKPKFINTLFPQALRESLFNKADIHLVFLNTCDQEFMGPLSSNILPLLSETLQSVQGSMIPLSVLSQPLYNMQFMNNPEKTLHSGEALIISDFSSSFHNSLMPFSSLFQLSLHHRFYSKENYLSYKCYITVNKDVKIPIKIMNMDKKDCLNEDMQEKYSSYKKVTWSKFVVQSTVSRRIHCTGYEMLLCLPNDIKSDASEDGFVKLNKSLSLEGINLLLECMTDCGINVPGLLVPLSTEAAIISILYPPNDHLFFKSDTKSLSADSLKVQNTEVENIAFKTQNFKTELKTFPTDVKSAEISENFPLKSFKMECLETWFSPASVSNLASYIQAKSSKNSSRIKSFYKMLQESARNSKKMSSKSSKKHLTEVCTKSVETNQRSGGNVSDNLSSSETENIDVEEMSTDLNYEELLSTVKKLYDSAVEQSSNIVTTAKRVLKFVMNYYKKENLACLEENVQSFFENNFIMTAKRISEKYEMSDTEEDTKKKIKECQIQVLIILEIENYKNCPNRPNCVSAVTSLLRLMIFNSGITDLQNFIHDVLLKNYSEQLYDVLVDIGDELNISIFDDEESTQSPTDTASSELINEEELFSSAISSNMSEKSSSSSNSRKDKDNNGLERKLLRRRSDISDTAGCRQVILPRSSSKQKKRKTVASKGIRCSPRIASRKTEQHGNSVCEKPRTVRRNLFPGSSQTPKKNKNKLPTTPKRGAHTSKSKFVAETPSHKQNHSALQRRKSFIEKLSESPKVIAESPQIAKTVKDGASKEMLEKLQKARHNTLNLSESKSQPSSCPSFMQYTPESKKRLSLKLFSKFLSSPTARMGVKKCTKRLFDQVSPDKDDESNNKRLKYNNESEQASFSTIKK